MLTLHQLHGESHRGGDIELPGLPAHAWSHEQPRARNMSGYVGPMGESSARVRR